MGIYAEKSVWSLEPEQIFEELGTNEGGLGSDEIEERRTVYGANVLERRHRLSGLKILLRQFQSPLIFILVLAGVMSAALGDYKDAIFIFLSAFVNAGLGYYQENKAEAALEKLRSYVTQRVRVMRDGHEQEVATEVLVPGDVFYVSQGDRIPADARVVYASDLQADEAVLTGESLPESKSVLPVAPEADLGDRSSMIWSGTLITQGVGRAVVVATGAATELGKIAELVAGAKEEQTPLQQALQRFSLKASGFIFLMAIGVFFIATQSGISVLDAFLISVAVLVSAVPEGLPIVMTVILATGVQRLAAKKGVVRRLSAAETLGSTSMILTDKTGTLTQAKMSLSRVRIFDEGHERHGGVSEAEDFLFHAALLNMEAVVMNPDAQSEDWEILGKPLEVALVRGAAKAGVLFREARANYEPVRILPFNSLNKFSASVYQFDSAVTPWIANHFSGNAPHVVSMVGAPEILLQFSDLSEEKKAVILEEIRAMAESGDRLVAVAIKKVSTIKDIDLNNHDQYQKMRFLGTISFRDPVRPSVAHAIREVQRAGIRVVIMTGDHEGTAIAVANELGIHIAPEHVLHGGELEAMSAEQIRARLPLLKLVSRVSPEGKLKVAMAFQEMGEIIAMNGDGINDAPALKVANIGVAMGSGTDVTKDVADLVLLDDNFETIVEAVSEGRRILRNMRKAIVYLGSNTLDLVFLIGGSLVIGLPLPFNALQILWVNLFTDSLPGIALAFEDQVDSETRRPLNVRHGIFTAEMKFLVFVAGIVSSATLFALYYWLTKQGYAEEVVRTFIFAAFGTYSLFLILSVRSLTSSIFKYNPFSNRFLIGSIGIGLFLMTIAIYAPFFQKLFDTVDLSAPWLLGVLAFGVFNILLIELGKMLYREDN
ncbi:MAG: hypothetical protein COU11_00685 [Candidatus Harrisonbacteria bacterium CG10_big_fil_rev_8_21_14_0_10_49_15]|uniref:Cation-transporting P-type ATPase N-terminal domain-containing protein n=1 Tax=Candidatus Harrisonbacteria bacterium CG10_big_fil_rev_8_21_14_0_10_49_15 TaxID=1974587 RepID=A0A2H0UP09_9BACT|nr:MAG: hypothetical protein COU11_00685 [Candidatus Harrisonbacteria bacterium CG10_big_fil_rev_8_21_14_0_10_49_15]